MAATPLFSQEQTALKLFIYKENKAVEKFGIANITTKTEGKFTDGYHIIKASEGDELFIASPAFKNFYKLVTSEDIKNKKIEVYINNGVMQLKEVVVIKSLKLTGFSQEKILPIENRVMLETDEALKPSNILYEARRKKSTTLNIPFIPLVNMITGRSKRLKKELKAYQALTPQI